MYKPQIFIGIDSGLSGGIAILIEDDNGNFVFVTPFPLSGKELDVLQIRDWITGKIGYSIDESVCYIENVHSMPGQGVASSFKFGLVTGEIRGMIKTMGIPLYTVAPQTWKKLVLADTDKSKEAAIAFCRNAYPEVSLLATEKSRVPHTGIADALCIAHYARMKYNT